MATRSWNRVELIGNLTRDPELRFVPSGTAVATFGIATNRVYVSDGERKEEVDFHRVVAWGKLAELCNQLLKKGSRVFISGRLQYREWETQDGQKKRDAEIVMEDMLLLTSKSGFYGSEESAESSSQSHSESTPKPQGSELADPDKMEVAVAPSEPEEKQDKPNEKITEKEVEDLPF